MKLITLAIVTLIIAACAASTPPITATKPTIGGQRVIDFSDRHAVYDAFQDAYKVGEQLMRIPPELENAADAYCFVQSNGRPAQALGIDLAQGIPICYASVPPQSVADRVCKSLDFADAQVEGSVITCRGPVQPSSTLKPDDIPPNARGV